MRVFLHPSLYSVDSFLVEDKKVLKLEGFIKTRMQPKNSRKPMFILNNANLHAKNTTFEFLPDSSSLIILCNGDNTSRVKGVSISQGTNFSTVSGVAFLVSSGNLRLEDVVVSKINFDPSTSHDNGIVLSRVADGSIFISNSDFSEIDFGNGNDNSVVTVEQSANRISNGGKVLQVNINFAKFNNCKGKNGGAVHVNAKGEVQVNITGSLFINNLASESGGAVHLNASRTGDRINATIDRSIFLDNKLGTEENNVPNNIHASEKNVKLNIHQSVSNHHDGLLNCRNLLNSAAHFIFVTNASHFTAYSPKHKGDQRNPFDTLNLPSDTLSKASDSVYGIFIGGGVFSVEKELVPPTNIRAYVVYGDSYDDIRGKTIISGSLPDSYFVNLADENIGDGDVELSSFNFVVDKSGLLSVATPSNIAASLSDVSIASGNVDLKSDFQQAMVSVNGAAIIFTAQNVVVSKTLFASSLFSVASSRIDFTNVNISNVKIDGGEILRAEGTVSLVKVSVKNSTGLGSDGVVLSNLLGDSVISDSIFQGYSDISKATAIATFTFGSTQGYLVVLHNVQNVLIANTRFTSASTGAVYVGEGVNVELRDNAALYNYKLPDSTYSFPGLRVNVLCGGSGGAGEAQSNVTLTGTFYFDTPKGGDEKIPWVNDGHRCNVKSKGDEDIGVLLSPDTENKYFFPKPANLKAKKTSGNIENRENETIVIDVEGDSLYPIWFGHRFVTRVEDDISTVEGKALVNILADGLSSPESALSSFVERGKKRLREREKGMRVLSSVGTSFVHTTAANGENENEYYQLHTYDLPDEHHLHLEFLRSGFPKGVELYLQLSNDGKYYSTVPDLVFFEPDNRSKSKAKNCCWWIVFPIIASVATVAAILVAIYIKRRKKVEEPEPEPEFNMEYDTNYDFGKSKLEKNDDQNFDAFMQSFNQSASKNSLEGVTKDENGEVVDLTGDIPEIDPFGDSFATGDGKVGIMMDEDGNIIDTTLGNEDGDLGRTLGFGEGTTAGAMATITGLDLADDIPIQLSHGSNSSHKPNSPDSDSDSSSIKSRPTPGATKSNDNSVSTAAVVKTTATPRSPKSNSRAGKRKPPGSAASNLKPMTRPVPGPDEPRKRPGWNNNNSTAPGSRGGSRTGSRGDTRSSSSSGNRLLSTAGAGSSNDRMLSTAGAGSSTDRMLSTAGGDGFGFFSSAHGNRNGLSTARSEDDMIILDESNVVDGYEPVDVAEISYEVNQFGEVPLLDADDL